MTPTHLSHLRRAAVATLVVASSAAAQQAPVSSGVVLVANQQSASATIVDIATRATTTLEVGAGPHETSSLPMANGGS